MLSVLGLCLVGSLGVHLEGATGVQDELARNLTAQLAKEVEELTGKRAVLESELPPEGDGVLVVIDGGATQVQLRAERRADQRVLKSAVARGPFSSEGWSEALRALARELFAETALSDPALPGETERGGRWLPAVLLGASVACIVGAVAFGASSLGAHSELREDLIVGEEARALSDRASSHGALSAAFSVGAVLTAGASLVLLLD